MDLKTWLTSRVTADEEIVELTNQFYVTLRASFARIQSAGPPRATASYARVEELLAPSRVRSWNDCYEVEQLMVELFDDEMLRTELEVRTLEARNLRPTLADHYVKEAQTATTPARQRALLARLINDLQWRYTVNEAKRRFSKVVTGRTGYIFVSALLAYALVVGWLISSGRRFHSGDFRLFYLAGLAGAWGASFSMLTSLKGRLEASEIYDLKLMQAVVMLLSRALIGAGAAGILYFFLLSGLLGGSAFPKLVREPSPPPAVASAEKPAVTSADKSADKASDGVDPCPSRDCLPAGDFALLVVWCFLAGFSEQLVPGLLAKTEAKADAAPPDRFRPPSPPPVSPPTANGPHPTKGHKPSDIPPAQVATT